MAALKCKEQQRDKKYAKYGDPHSSGKIEHKTAVWNFFCGAHALKCIAMEGSFLLCNVREYTHSRVSIIHSRWKCFVLAKKMQSSEKKMRRRQNTAERKCPVAENAMKFLLQSSKKNVIFFFFICNAACKETHKEKQGQQIFNAHGWMIMCGSRKMKGIAQQCIV